MSEPNPTTKECTRCHETKIIQEFHRQTKSPDGYRTVCKKCRAIAEGKVYIPHEPEGFKYCRHCERMLPATPEYYQRTPHGKYGLESRCRDCKKGESRIYHYTQNEVILLRKRNNYKANPEKEIKRSRDFRVKNPTYIHDWYINSKERLTPLRRVYSAKRRALEAQADGYHTTDDIEQIYFDQEGRCGYCGIQLFGKYHLEHIVPLSRGGSNWPDNLLLTCSDCNLSKNDKTLPEWEAVRGW